MSRRNGVSGFAAVVIALIVGTVAALGVIYWDYIAAFFDDVGEYFERVDEDLNKPAGDDTTGTGEAFESGAFISGVDESGVALSSYAITAAQYSEFGVAETAESAYSLTATVEPTDVFFPVDWAVEWVDPASDWATGKTVTDYVTVTTATDGANTATVSCLQAFGEQIKITVTVRENVELTATCTVDYQTKITKLQSARIKGSAGTWNKTKVLDLNYVFYEVKSDEMLASIVCDFNSSVGTLPIGDCEEAVQVKFNDAFFAACEDAGLSGVIRAANTYLEVNYLQFSYSIVVWAVNSSGDQQATVDYMNNMYEAKLNNAISACEGQEIGTVKITKTDGNSTVEREYALIVSDAWVVATGVSTSESNLTF